MPSLLDVRLGQNPVVERLLYGHKTEGLIGQELFPVFPFSWDSGTVPIMSPENSRVWDTACADGADVPVGELRLSRAVINKTRHRFATKITDGMLDQWSISGVSPEQWAAQNSMDVINRRYELDCSLVACNAASYNAALSLNLAALWANVATTLLTTHIFPAMLAVRNRIGRRPNLFWCDYATWQAIQLNTQVATQAAYMRGIIAPVAGGLAPEMVSTEAFANLIGVKRVIVSEAMFGSDATPIVYGDPWSNGAGVALASGCAGLVYEAPTGMMEPSFGYTFRTPGYPQAKMPYRDEKSESTYYEVKDIRGPQIVPPTTGATRTDSGFLWIRTIV